MDVRHRRCHRRDRRATRIEVSRPGALAELERIPPKKPDRDKDALHEIAGPAPHGPRLRPPGGRSLGAHRGPEWYTSLGIPVTEAVG